MAAGAFITLLRTLLETAYGILVLDPAVTRLEDVDRAAVIRDFAALRRHLMMYFTLKLSHWRQLPWVLCGLAHHVRASAVDCARRALALAQHHAGPMHRLAALMLAPGTVYHAQMILFIDGADLMTLPALAVMVAMFKFIPISERWVESRHAIVKKSLAGIHAGTIMHICFVTSLRTIENMLESEEDGLSTLARHCERTRNPCLILKEIGFSTHQAIQKVLRDAAGFKSPLHGKLRKTIIQIVYHCDTMTMFQALPPVEPNSDDDGDDGAGGGGGGRGGGHHGVGAAEEVDDPQNGNDDTGASGHRCNDVEGGGLPSDAMCGDAGHGSGAQSGEVASDAVGQSGPSTSADLDHGPGPAGRLRQFDF